MSSVSNNMNTSSIRGAMHWGSLASLLGRVGGILSQLAITAILSRTLEPAAFGFWALLYTIYTLIPNFDLGLGQALRLKLAQINAEGNQDQLEQKLFFSVALILLGVGIIAGLMATAGVLGLGFHPELGGSLLGFVWVCALTLCLNLGAQVFYAYNESIERGWLDLLQGLLLLVAVGLLANSGLSNLLWGYYGLAFLVGVLVLGWFVRRRRWRMEFPQVSGVLEVFNLLWGRSMWFWLLAMFAIGLYATSPLFVAHAAGLEQVGYFVILQRLFGVLTMIHLAWLTPLQSAYTRAAAQHNWSWIRQAWRNSLQQSLGLGVACVGLWWLYQPIVQLWTGQYIHQPLLAFWLALSAVGWAWVNVNSVVLNGLGIIKPQVWLLILGFALYVPLNLMLLLTLGLMGAPIATLLAILPIAVMNFVWVRRHLWSKPI